MSSSPPNVLPPLVQLPLIYDTYADCQLQYLFARELTKNQKNMGWKAAYEEANLVLAALKASDTPLALGARPGEVVWWLMLCMASGYSMKPPADRELVRQNVAAGMPIWAVLAVLTEPDMCDPEVLADPEYQPVPPCIPRKPATALVAGLGSAFWVIGMWTAFRAMEDAAETRERLYYESIENEERY